MVFVAAGAESYPGGEFGGDFAVVCTGADIPDFLRYRAPAWAVSGFGSGQGVCHLVKQGLVHVIVFIAGGEVPGY